MSTRRYLVLLTAVLLAASCGSDSKSSETPATGERPDAAGDTVEQAIMPGEGLVAGGKEIRLGLTRASLEQALGPPASLRDLGALGLRFAYPDLHLSGMLAGPEQGAEVTSLTAHPGFDEGSAERTWVGVPESEIHARLGEPLRDPFLGVWWYRGDGVAFEMDGASVVAVTVFARGD